MTMKEREYVDGYVVDRDKSYKGYIKVNGNKFFTRPPRIRREAAK